MGRLAIFGASGHGKVVADAALASGLWGSITFFDDAYPQIKTVEKWSIAGDGEDLIRSFNEFSGVVVAIGTNATRFQKQQYLHQNGCKIVSIIHPRAVVSTYASIELGSVVMAGAVINPFARIGPCCIINSNSVVEHDCVLEDGVHISPGSLLAGNVRVGRYTWIGMGSSVRQNIDITDDVIVGAGSVIVKDVIKKGTYFGNPAFRFV